ncbi:MAG TPA: signal peptidase II [Candidatus Binataceae bacterium]|nr:signal peptidase II [Candidatus Binataceae bacterium]
MTSPTAAVLSDGAAKAPRGHPAIRLIGWITVPVLILDQATKWFVKTHMEMDESIPVIRNLLDITYVQNPGAAFSMFAQSVPWLRAALLVALSTTAIVVLGILLWKTDRITPTSVAFSLILAGATGNLIDRAARGQVIDFIRAHYYAWNYPIFNVADSAISIGVTLIVLVSLFGHDHNDGGAPPRTS